MWKRVWITKTKTREKTEKWNKFHAKWNQTIISRLTVANYENLAKANRWAIILSCFLQQNQINHRITIITWFLVWLHLLFLASISFSYNFFFFFLFVPKPQSVYYHSPRKSIIHQHSISILHGMDLTLFFSTYLKEWLSNLLIYA